MMDLNVAFHEEAGKQICNINQVSLNIIPLKMAYTKGRATKGSNLLSGLLSFPSRGQQGGFLVSVVLITVLL